MKKGASRAWGGIRSAGNWIKDKATAAKDAVSNFIFGPEGGLTDKELMLFDDDFTYSLGDRRLRTETAIIKVASLL